jgi:hypothetical protein
MAFCYATREYFLAETIFSGERRQLACGVRQLAEHDLVGKLPTNAGWQPALPGVFARKARPESVRG